MSEIVSNNTNELPAEEYKLSLYNVYCAIFHAKALEKNREKLLTPLFAYQPWSWRVVGISVDAIALLRQNSFKTTAGLVRDHFKQNRIDTYRAMLHLDEPLSYEAWWELFWENDPTIIITKDEHRNIKSKHTIGCVPLSWREGLFSCNPLIGFKLRKTVEGDRLEKLIKQQGGLDGLRQICVTQCDLTTS